MKTKELCMLLAGLFLVGCSADEEIANVSTSESNAISFNVVSNNPQTKATILNNETFKGSPIEVFAFKNGEHYMGKPNVGDWRNDGVEISYQDGIWNYSDSKEQLFWPHVDPLDFYAISPVTYHPTGWDINATNPSLSFLLGDEYYSSSNEANPNVDVMYAIAKNQTKATNNGQVKLVFKHALSQVLFNAKTKNQQIHVEIESMNLYNVYASGTFTLSNPESEVSNWSNYGMAMPFTVGMEETPLSVSTTVVSISGDKTMLYIPQQRPEWEPNMYRISEVENNKLQSYLEITCKIWQNVGEGKEYFVGTNDNYGKTYVPFSVDWQSGKRYVYTLCFGAGYNADGSEIDIVPITFDAEVTNWVDDDNHIDNF